MSSELLGAARLGRTEDVKRMLDAGEDVNARTVDGYTALIEAAFRNRLDMVTLLLARGADVNARSGGGWMR